MKKITGFLLAIALPTVLLAQDSDGIIRGNDMIVFNIISMIFVLWLCMLFILNIMKRIMEFRIKNKVVDKGIPEHLADKLLQPAQEENGNTSIKWFFMLAGLGVAFSIINYTQPVGIHSIATLAFCMAASFLGFYLFTHFTRKKETD